MGVSSPAPNAMILILVSSGTVIEKKWIKKLELKKNEAH